jgi:hypothetical protein
MQQGEPLRSDWIMKVWTSSVDGFIALAVGGWYEVELSWQK